MKVCCHDEHLRLTAVWGWGAREVELHVVVFENGAAALHDPPPWTRRWGCRRITKSLYTRHANFQVRKYTTIPPGAWSTFDIVKQNLIWRVGMTRGDAPLCQSFWRIHATEKADLWFLFLLCPLLSAVCVWLTDYVSPCFHALYTSQISPGPFQEGLIFFPSHSQHSMCPVWSQVPLSAFKVWVFGQRGTPFGTPYFSCVD